ncbi:MAG: choice-of-anchor D domain-containing protein [Deltaproteobacteria bacterium]|nr:choice-of-anchor D domain-containing protein [Deltaproteobacteria bacterium]
MSDYYYNYLYGATGSEVLTNDTGHTIQGSGHLGHNQMGIINQGLILANLTNNNLNINPYDSLGLTNSGTLQVNAGSTMIINDNLNNYTSNTLNGGTYKVYGTDTDPGTMRLPSGSDIINNAATILLDGPNANLYNGGTGTVDALANLAVNDGAGRFTIENGRNFTTAGAFANAGMVQVGYMVGDASTFTTTGAFTNTGTLQMQGGAFAAGTGGSLTNETTGEVNGYGTISTPVLNHGLVRAAGGNLIATIDGQSGTVRIDPDASLTLSGDSDAEYLIHNGSTADSLALGAYNFTVDKDYTNANFGVGNSFNRRANVSGSGQIIGNHAAQAITGDVTDGTTSTVTMDLGNVRGNESKTLNYQIANTGTGADIRGAVQTAVNGGNITDSRLSGTGVTADNFGPITAGNDSGDLGVTFSATSGGALDGQSIAIVSNFDNITTQVININGFASALAEGNATPNSPQPLVLGNFHVGTTSNPSRNFAVTNTTSGAGAEQLGIASATATGNFSAGNNLGTGLISGGATSTDAVTVQVSGGTAGINNGAVAIQYLTDGTNIDPTFTAQNANLQNIEVQATGYNLAVGSVLPSPIALANQRVGGTATQALTVANTAPADATYTETLSAQFGTDKGNAVNNGGSVSGIAGGSSNITALSAGVDTSVAGLRTGTVTINMTSHEVNGSGLGDTTLTPQTINVSGNVYQVAQPTLDSNNIVFANRRVGDTAQQALTITNTSAAPAGYQEALNASFSGTTGDAQAGGTLTQLGQGASDSTSLMVGIDTSTAGAKSGTADLALASDGTGTSGLGILALNPQTVTVSGAVYRLAEANTISPVNFGVVHVGDSVEQALAISNLAVADGYSESLNAFFGGVSDARILTTGSISLLGAGSTDNASMIVGIDTSAVGYVNGTATVNLQSDGTGTSGLGIVDLASQDVGVTADIVTGMVVRYANPLINTLQPVDMGNVRIGTTAETALSITNNVPNDGWSEYLIGAAGTTTGGITSSGSFASLAPEATDTTSITVGIDTATAGAKTGTATIDFQSDGTMFGGTITDLASQDVSVQGAVYRLANPTLDTPSVTLAARVGDASPTANVGMTNASPDSYTEGLKAGIGTSSTGFGATGSIANLAAMASDSSSLAVHLDTSTAGTFTGTADLTLFSTGTGTTGATDYALPGQSVALDGKVYTPAVGQIDSTTIDFGIVHVGETVSAQALTVKNNAAVTALNDVLTGSFTGSSGPFTVGGDLGSGLAAQATDSSSLTAAVDTSTAGVFNVSAMVNFASHNNDMADLDLGSVGIDIMAQVNNYADPVFQKNSGDGVLTVAGLTFTLDFGTIVFDHSVEAYLSLLNDVAGPADLLKGTFTDNTAEFGATGFDAFTDIEAGESLYDLFVSLDALTLGSFEESIVLHAIGYNAGGYEGAFDDITLILKGRVIESGGPTVPEPMTGLLLLIGLTGIGIIRKRFTN